MIAMFRLSPIGTRQLRQILESALYRAGPANIAPELLDVAALLRAEDTGAHSTPLDATEIVDGTLAPNTVTMSYSEAADVLGVGVRTVSRRVASGGLEAIGRRITRQSLSTLVSRTAA